MEILEQLKAIIENEVLNESSKDFYLREISELKKENQQEIINLVERMEQAGFKNNFASAFSEVTENIPQFARMTVFKELHKISRNVEVNCDYACDLDESGDWDNLIEKFKKCFSKEDAEKFLRIYTKGVIARIYDFFEEGNPRAAEDDLNWVLLETKEDGSHSERVIQGFWEDDFEEDDFDWDREED
ncbi:peroxidase [Prevotella aurantiaca]